MHTTELLHLSFWKDSMHAASFSTTDKVEHHKEEVYERTSSLILLPNNSYGDRADLQPAVRAAGVLPLRGGHRGRLPASTRRPPGPGPPLLG